MLTSDESTQIQRQLADDLMFLYRRTVESAIQQVLGARWTGMQPAIRAGTRRWAEQQAAEIVDHILVELARDEQVPKDRRC